MSRHTTVLEKSNGAREDRVAKVRACARSIEPNAFTNLIARVVSGQSPLRTVAFVSALPREGVSYIIRRVADELERTSGLRSAVAQASEVLAAPSPGVQILGVPSFSYAPERLELLAVLRSEFDVVLVDAGCLATSNDILGVAGQVDAVILVVEAGRTPRADVRRAVETITAAGGNVAGVILNKRRQWLPGWLEKLIG